MIAAVCIDTWKLKIFKKTLDDMNYSYSEHHSPKMDMITLRVDVNDLIAFSAVVESMEQQARNSKLN